MSIDRDTSTLDAIYLEWSQFTVARNHREHLAANNLSRVVNDLEKLVAKKTATGADYENLLARIRAIVYSLR